MHASKMLVVGAALAGLLGAGPVASGQAGASGATSSTPVSATPAVPNLIVNGNFSLPKKSGYFTVSSTAQKAPGKPIPGWTVGADSVDIIGSDYWPPPPNSPRGSQSIDLSGTAPGSLTQIVNTTPGWDYLLTWYAAGNPGCGQPTKIMHVLWDNVLVAHPAMSIKGRLLSSMGWSLERQVVAASSARSVLVFADATPDKSDCGAALGDVSLAADANLYFPATTLGVAPNGKIKARVRFASGTTITDSSLVVRLYGTYKSSSFSTDLGQIAGPASVVGGQVVLSLHLPASLAGKAMNWAGKTISAYATMEGPEFVPVTEKLNIRVTCGKVTTCG
jgi:hypothetical protein